MLLQSERTLCHAIFLSMVNKNVENDEKKNVRQTEKVNHKNGNSIETSAMPPTLKWLILYKKYHKVSTLQYQRVCV